MTHRFSQFMFTPAVRAVQEAEGSRRAYERLDAPGADPRDTLGGAERAFIAARDSFLSTQRLGNRLALCSASWAPPGFLKVLDDRTLGFADFLGPANMSASAT